jgi:hypothetical protein
MNTYLLLILFFLMLYVKVRNFEFINIYIRTIKYRYLTVRLRIFHVCCNENFRNSYLSFYWKKWFYIWYMALAWWLVLCLPLPGLLHIYFLFTVWLTNERVGVFLARRSVQHLVVTVFAIYFADRKYKVNSWIDIGIW